MKHKIQLKSWDRISNPDALYDALVLKAAPIWVPRIPPRTHLRDLHQQMQATLDKLRIKGDARW